MHRITLYDTAMLTIQSVSDSLGYMPSDETLVEFKRRCDLIEDASRALRGYFGGVDVDYDGETMELIIRLSDSEKIRFSKLWG